MRKTPHFSLYFAALAFLLPPLATGCKKNSEVVARVGNTRITQQDFAKEIANSPPAYQNYLTTLEGKKQFLDIILKEKVLLNEAERSGLSNNREIQKSLREYRERAAEQEKEFRKSLVLREFLRSLQDGELKITEAEMRAYYDQNQADYKSPVRVNASHILLPDAKDADEVLKRLRKGEDFGRVAREVSKDPSAIRGGLIGDIMRGDLQELPEFENALFQLKNGEVSDVVQTKIGFHIIRKNGEQRMQGQTFEQAAPQIRRILEKQRFDRWIEAAKIKQKVQVNDQALASIPVQAASDEGLPDTATP